MPPLERPWLIGHLRCGSEVACRDRLIDAGYVVYVPVRMVQPVEHRRRWPPPVAVETAIFPGYLFLRRSRLRVEAHKVPGWYGLVTVLGEPAAVRDADVEALRLRVDRGDYADAVPRQLQVGDVALLVGGPFEGATVEVVSVATAGRARTRITASGLVLDTDADALEVVNQRR